MSFVPCDEPSRYIPYCLVLGSFFYLKSLKQKLKTKYDEFIKNSPGKNVDTEGIEYGVGHGH